MLDISHILSQQQSTFIFYATGDWQTWSKPRNAKMIEIFCIGGGGGGGQGGQNGSTGGGGGGSAGIVRGIIPAFLLPDTIYIQVAKGGAGTLLAGTGDAGGISYISLRPSTSEQTLICKSSTAGAGGGTSTGGGAAATVSSLTLSTFGNLGLFTAIAGVGGGAGTAGGAAGSNVTALASNLTTGGAGAAGKGATVFGTGGNILPAPVILTSTVNGGQTEGADGQHGYGTLQPFCGTGGAGGASNLAGTGGKGGNGFYGCGGGAAGGGTTPTLSRSGDGGDGLVIITVIT